MKIKNIALITALVGLVGWAAWAADATFSYTGTARIQATPFVTAKVPVLVTVTNGPTPVATMTNAALATITRTIQNCGTNAVLYCLGGTVATTNYHGVLAGGLAVRDGLGSIVDISAWPGAVSLMTESGESPVSVVILLR